MTILFGSYKHRNRLPKTRVRRYQQRLQVDVHERRNRQRKEVVAKRKVSARAETEGLRAGWLELGRIWPGPTLAGRARPRLGPRLFGCSSPGRAARRRWPDLVWPKGEEKGKERKKKERKRGGKEKERKREREEGDGGKWSFGFSISNI